MSKKNRRNRPLGVMADRSFEPVRPRPFDPVLRFSVEAWIKLKFMCHAGDTEVGGFGISSAKDPLYIEKFVTVKQKTSSVTVKFDDDDVARHFEDHVLADIDPRRCGRIWCHTHPGSSSQPSGVDEDTFHTGFGRSDWAVMMILAKGGSTYAALAVDTPLGRNRREIPVKTDWDGWMPHPTDFSAELWYDEYLKNIQPEPCFYPGRPIGYGIPATIQTHPGAYQESHQDAFDEAELLAHMQELDRLCGQPTGQGHNPRS